MSDTTSRGFPTNLRRLLESITAHPEPSILEQKEPQPALVIAGTREQFEFYIREKVCYPMRLAPPPMRGRHSVVVNLPDQPMRYVCVNDERDLMEYDRNTSLVLYGTWHERARRDGWIWRAFDRYPHHVYVDDRDGRPPQPQIHPRPPIGPRSEYR